MCNYNLGDEITTILLSKLFSIEHQLSPLKNADLISTGSVLQSIWGHRYRFRRKPIGVVGSGFIYAETKIRKLNFAKIYSVRGHLSKQLLIDKYPENISIGDPGLLISKALAQLKINQSKQYKYGVIPHFTQLEAANPTNTHEVKNQYKIIDFRTNDINRIINEMLSCEIIISQALHGLIIADSFRIPNIWLDNGPLHTGGNFKFYDYFSSIGRPFHLKIESLDNLESKAIIENTFIVNESLLSKLQEDITLAFNAFFKDFKAII